VRIPARLLLVLLPLASCGATDPAALNDEGYAALGYGRDAEAASRFEAAVDALGGDTSSPEYERARIGLVEATLRVDPAAAREGFLAFAATGRVDAADYGRIGTLLAGDRHFVEAIKVLHAGVEAHPETPELIAILEDIEAEALKDEDADALAALGSLGYLGGK
jgi:hypothetical protein